MDASIRFGLYIIGGHLDSVKNTVAMADDGSGAAVPIGRAP